jgi:sugar/nucleoside kinase (ribokinase family)
MHIIVYGNPFPDHFVRLLEEALHKKILEPRNKGKSEDKWFKKGDTILTSREDVAQAYQSITNDELGNHYSLGGSGANVAKVLAQLFRTESDERYQVTLIGRVGGDAIGKGMIHRLQELGLNVVSKVGKLLTGIVSCFVTPDKQRTMLCFLGAVGEPSLDDIAEEDLKDVDHVHIEGYQIIPSGKLEKIIKIAKKLNPNVTISLDLAAPNLVTAFHGRFLSMMRQVDFIFGNRIEFEAVNGKKEIDDAFFKTFSKEQIVLVTDGAQGCLVKDHGTDIAVHYDAFRINEQEVVDTTGAGDYWDAGFLYGYLRKLSIQKCVDLANWAATRVICHLGADLDPSGWKELQKGADKIDSGTALNFTENR